MNYNIFSSTAPAMLSPAKGTEFVKLLLSQASKDMFEPLVPMFFPILGEAHPPYNNPRLFVNNPPLLRNTPRFSFF